MPKNMTRFMIRFVFTVATVNPTEGRLSQGKRKVKVGFKFDDIWR